ncbi:MAG: DUF378 domain-containing protein [Candidatus Levybacteria bacterium]|nr:DUF378 domain-containing protein [Candidatus Levybacteria bacterium]
MSGLKVLAWWLVIIGALNWLLVGLGAWLGGTSWNLVMMIFGSMPMLENLVYVLVGLSGLWLLWDKMMGGKK